MSSFQSNCSEKVLFIHSGGLGDIVLLSPALKALSESLNEKAKLDLLVETRAFQGSKEFFQVTDNKINEIKFFDFKGKFAFLKIFSLLAILRNYSTIISSGRSPLISLLLFLSGAKKRIGFKSSTGFLLTDQISLNESQYASSMLFDLIKPFVENREFFSKTGNQLNLERSSEILSYKQGEGYSKPQISEQLLDMAVPAKPLIENLNLSSGYILIHPGVSKLSLQKGIIKSPDIEYWIELIKEALGEFPNFKIVLTGGPDEKELVSEFDQALSDKPNFINLLKEKSFSLLETTQLIKQSKVFICADSAPLHLAISVNASIVALFGPTDPVKLIPEKEINKSIKIIKVANLLCQPCLWNRRAKSCKLPLCVKLQKTEWVIQAIKEFIQ
jgi:putative inorganic carbon (HCO3(-)) transporter